MNNNDLELLYTIKAHAYGGIVTMSKTQAELAQLLTQPGFRLISVNDTGGQFCRRNHK